MKITRIFILLVLLSVLSDCSTAPRVKPRNRLSYILRPGSDGKSINVELRMQGNSRGKTYIQHVKTWAGNDFTDDVTELKVLNPGATLEVVEKSDKRLFTKIINHKPNETLWISYKITQNVPTPDKTYRAIIKPHYFHIIGQAGWVTPSGGKSPELYEIKMEFKGFPENFKFANSFFAEKRKSVFTAKLDEFLYGVYVGGDFRIGKMMIKGKPLYVSVRGRWKFKDQDLFNLAKNIVEYQRNFFNDHEFDQFLINVLPNERTCCSSGGTGLTNSFASFMPDDATLGSHIKFLLSHELFHTWNGKRIKRVEPEQLVYWFSEGFTDYYSRLFLLRSKDITLQEYVEDYNETLYEYYTSDAINYPNDRILKDFWNDYQVEKLPYRRGNILARKWNAQIKLNSESKNSMDNILMDLFNESQSIGTKVSAKNFIRLANKYHPSGFRKDIETYINKGTTIVPGKDDLGSCVSSKEAFGGGV